MYYVYSTICGMNDNSSVYLSIADKVRADIFSGRLQPGARLPSVRDLAVREGVNPNTAQKAFSELENEKLIVTDRTNGKYATEDVELISELREKYASDLTRKYENEMREMGAEVKVPKITWLTQEVRNRTHRVRRFS